MRKTIGIPRGMYYHDYHPMWTKYFNNLDGKVVFSPKTNKDILNLGVSKCVDEACLPVKIFHGHVEYLKDKVDYIFIPKFISICKREYCCPKLLGLPDMVKHSIEELPIVIEPEINLRKVNSLRNAVINTGRIFTRNHFKIANAYMESMEFQKYYKSLLSLGIIPTEDHQNTHTKDIKILVLGHSYNVYDEFINMNIFNKLIENHVNIITADMVSADDINYYSNMLPKRIFWTDGKKIIGAAYSLLEKNSIDGIIYLSAFGCGLDSVLVDLIQRKATSKGVPFLLMTMDEQTGEAGFNTRLEAFLDMMEWRNKNEDYISSIW
ncbi:2-hydroxyacyl-CoA dehydratase [Tissierella sp. MSJ-40]|uniref:2-hydroxyacyl-CoA dehydratase n=1 Tax=Tissierella simiarum TaxID=2841534 RepID=A0ABS6EB43_9FIRM|nr:acyl-CoA dehydratase activase-related protein [Tissierella simiarum]MBU5440081.1 2-hydroxyacyl-CoA dehydratase [Tissierella simiarum]